MKHDAIKFLFPVFNEIYPYYKDQCPTKLFSFVSKCLVSGIPINRFEMDQFLDQNRNLLGLVSETHLKNFWRNLIKYFDIESKKGLDSKLNFLEKILESRLTGSLIEVIDGILKEPKLNFVKDLESFLVKENESFWRTLNFIDTEVFLILLVNLEIRNSRLWMFALCKFFLDFEKLNSNKLNMIHKKISGIDFEKWGILENRTLRKIFESMVLFLKANCMIKQNNKVIHKLY